MVNTPHKLRFALSKTISLSLIELKLEPQMGLVKISTTWNRAGI